MFKNIIISIAILLLPCAPLIADQEAMPYAYVVTSQWKSGKYYFKMKPDSLDRFNKNKGSGALYEVSAVGPDKVLWTTSGWYAFTTFITWDGKYLVRMGHWPAGHEPKDFQLGIAFYKEGTLIKSYSTKELIKNPRAIRSTVSHYKYLKETPGFKEPYNFIVTKSSNAVIRTIHESPDRYHFVIKTMDNIEYTFDASEGTIVSQKQLEDEKESSLEP